jgi:hypothetical protein
MNDDDRDARDARRDPIGDPPQPPPIDRQEVARFLRPQPPWPVPRRTFAAAPPGLVAGSCLGYRVIRRLQGQS